MSLVGKNPRLLLINPWIYDFTAFDLWSKPVGLLYLASYLRSIGYEIDYIDCMDKYHPGLLSNPHLPPPKVKKYGTGHFLRQRIEKPAVFDFVPRYFARYGIPEDIFISELKKLQKPSAVLVTSFMTYWYLGPKRVIEIIRQIFPGVPVILGGIYATLLPEHARQILQPDFVVTGPGEIQIEKLLSDIIPEAPRHSHSPASLDEFPPPAFDLYHHLDYIVVLTSRGCPYRCTFCATDKISGPYTQRQPEAVVAEIIDQVRRFKVSDIAFYDDALLLNKHQRLIPILQHIIDRGVKVRFHTPNGLHAKYIDQQMAALFRVSGFTTIRLSFETSNPERFADMKNKVTPDELKTAVHFLVEAGFPPQQLEAYVLMGLPHQSFDEIYDSINFVHSLGIKIRLASYSPIPGTIDFQRAVQDGLFPPDADPLLTNKSIYPLHRTLEAYKKFQEVRNLVRTMNEKVEQILISTSVKNHLNPVRNWL